MRELLYPPHSEVRGLLTSECTRILTTNGRPDAAEHSPDCDLALDALRCVARHSIIKGVMRMLRCFSDVLEPSWRMPHKIDPFIVFEAIYACRRPDAPC